MLENNHSLLAHCLHLEISGQAAAASYKGLTDKVNLAFQVPSVTVKMLCYGEANVVHQSVPK